MKQGVAISLIVHTAALALVIFSRELPIVKKPTPKPKVTEVVLTNAPPPKTSKIIPLSPMSDMFIKKPLKRKGYYGIGVYCNLMLIDTVCEGQIYASIKITGVVDGYPASALGLRSGDSIIEIEGNPINYRNDVMDTGPTMINFTICRDGKKIRLTTMRAFIYND
jgi:membrane-associated protease RseP (regulator of RpoE activity)